MYLTLNHPTGAPVPVSARSIPEVTRFHRPFEIGPEQLSRRLFPLDASGMNLRTPSGIGWPSRVTVPLVGILLTPHPAVPTRAASRAQPTHARALGNGRSMSVTYQLEIEKRRGRARAGPAATAEGFTSRCPGRCLRPGYTRSARWCR